MQVPARAAGQPASTTAPGATKAKHGDPLKAAADQATPEPAAADKV